ncbi:MAG: glycosyltransferase family 9 protein [Simkaniaceae bacterium]|nr:glycosyltransferase family 9 protein [Simkaniaceae bacterium]
MHYLPIESIRLSQLKNLIIKALLPLFSRRRLVNLTRKNRRILVVSTTGLGDTLWGTPAIRAIKKEFNNAFIAVLTSPVGFEVLKNNPHVDKLILFNWRSFFRLKKLQFDTALIFHTSQRMALPIAYSTGAGTIIGNEGMHKDLDCLLTKAVKNSKNHEILQRFDLLKELGIFAEDTSLEIATCPEEVPTLCDPLIGMHPSANDPFKRWDKKYFVEVGNRLSSHGKIILTGSPNEKQYLESIAEKIPESTVITDLSVQGLAALIKRFSLYLTNDTGPMHLGFAVGTKTLGLFAATDPKLCGPLNISHGSVIAKPRTCTPCLKQKCREPFCMLQITPDEVYKKAMEILNENS